MNNDAVSVSPEKLKQEMHEHIRAFTCPAVILIISFPGTYSNYLSCGYYIPFCSFIRELKIFEY